MVSMLGILPFKTKDDLCDKTKTSFGDEYILSGAIDGCKAIYKSASKSVKVFPSKELGNFDVEDEEFFVEYIEGDLINKVVFKVGETTDVWTLNKKGEILAVDGISKG